MSRSEPSRQLIVSASLQPTAVDSMTGAGAGSSRIGSILLTLAIAVLLLLAGYLAIVAHRLDSDLVIARMDLTPDGWRLRQYHRQMEVLEEKMAGYIADSVETKLHAIEQQVTAGSVGSDEIRQFEELKNELQLLQRYTTGKDGAVTDSSRRDHPRLQPTPGSRVEPPQSEILGELVQVKYLLYLGIASCGMMAMLMGGYWWQSELRWRRRLTSPTVVPLLPGRCREP
ncbi:MAG: hypothetical protein FIA97_03155 [Methylococcaceae bacterium]|nr:hypothetical protein [Methylococcaceae bacterium]